VTLDVAFTNLSDIKDIAVTRMRPLLWIGQNIFTINGRLDFHKGWSENPMVGTTEDWIIANTIYFPHPIHIHLINFQVIREYDLQLLIFPNTPGDNDTTDDC
jgi:FtsP/CotA-like multicopper oxidase with cupredoxin domain